MEPVKVNLGGRQRMLRYRPSCVREFEIAMGGKTLLESIPTKGFTTLATLLWSGLKHEDDRLTVAKIYRYLDEYVDAGGDVTELWEDVGRALVDGGVLGRREGKAQETLAD